MTANGQRSTVDSVYEAFVAAGANELAVRRLPLAEEKK